MNKTECCAESSVTLQKYSKKESGPYLMQALNHVCVISRADVSSLILQELEIIISNLIILVEPFIV